MRSIQVRRRDVGLQGLLGAGRLHRVLPTAGGSMTNSEPWPPLKMALWNVLMAEQLNDGHYIKAFDLIEKLYAAAQSALATAPAEPLKEPSLAGDPVVGADTRCRHTDLRRWPSGLEECKKCGRRMG